MSVQRKSRAASKSVAKIKKVSKVRVIKKVTKLPNINLIPTANWMVTTAYIEVEKNSLFVGGTYKPTFLNMQQVLAIGPRTEDVKVGDWVYIDMNRFIKTTKKKSTIRAGVGGEDMISEQLVPPIFAAPGDPNTYFKINDREIEGVIKDPFSMKKEFDTLEAYVERQEKMEKEAQDARDLADKLQREANQKKILTIEDAGEGRQGPIIRTSTSPNLKN